jgi:hypothetical protein
LVRQTSAKRGIQQGEEGCRVARPKLPIEQRRRLTMTVRIRQDLDEGFAAVAYLRGTTKSGLVSEYAAEQIRVEEERNRARFSAALKEIRSQRREQRGAKRKPKPS